MACWTIKLTEPIKAKRETTLDRLRKELAAGTLTVKIAPSGAVAFSKPLNLLDDGYSDVCAYRVLASKNDPALRKAVMRAEAMSGRKVSEAAIAAGIHSHDGGKTWGGH